MSLPRYPAYKDSGVSWLGDVPAHWESTPLKHLVSVPITDGPHETPSFLDDGIPFVSAEAVSSGAINFEKIRGYISTEDHSRYSTKYKPQLHDIYMIKSGATTGVAAIVETEIEFNIWSPLAAIRCDRNKANPYFVLGALRSKNFQESVALNWNFGTQQNIGMGVLGNLTIALPPLAEQEAIASFLDRETAKIDALIAEQEKLIALLAEKRQATISRAVTRGLDPDVPLKDSGVPWLGKVPAHWNVCRLKTITPQVTVGIVVEPSKYYCDEGVPALRSLNVQPGKIVFDNFVYISNEANELLAKSKLRKGDLVSVRSGQTGVTAVIPEELDGCNCIDLIIIRRPEKHCEHFLSWYFSSNSAQRQFSEGSGGAIQQHFNIGMAMNLQITLPPLDEQYQIVDFIDGQTAKIDALVGSAKHSILLLKERRAALISAAVTGKIDVRGLAA